MTSKTRQNLKSQFVNGTIPTEKDFADLIDSTLIKRDDHFFGRWEPGQTYYNGDVVLYKKSIYILELPENEDECTQAQPGEPLKNPKEIENQSICSETNRRL